MYGYFQEEGKRNTACGEPIAIMNISYCFTISYIMKKSNLRAKKITKYSKFVRVSSQLETLKNCERSRNPVKVGSLKLPTFLFTAVYDSLVLVLGLFKRCSVKVWSQYFR